MQIMTINPVIPREEIDEVKARLREYSERINSGESDFSTLAILYSEDGSSMYGGEIGFRGRSALVPEYAAVAFNLNDTKKVSKIVETALRFRINLIIPASFLDILKPDQENLVKEVVDPNCNIIFGAGI